jgi:hypothetical protein
MNEVVKCPGCKGELEGGFIHASSGIFWDKRKPRWKLFTSEREELISRWTLGIPSTQAWRCTKCNLVVFCYNKKVLSHE